MKFICAPMATISHPAFRILVEKFGSCDEYYNEMINAPSLLNGGPFEKFYINPFPVPEKMVWQLTGKDISSFLKAIPIIHSLPGIGIDLNMGCCAPDIVRSGAGIAWMEKPLSETESLVKEAGEIIRDLNARNAFLDGKTVFGADSTLRGEKTVFGAENALRGCETVCGAESAFRAGETVCNSEDCLSDSENGSFGGYLDSALQKKRFSVKCRLGSDDFTDESFFSFTDMLVKNGVERITLHPRTHKQKYRDKPRYEYAEKLALRYKNENVEVVVNGDISDEKSFQTVKTLCPDCCGVMIGRMAVQKPWIFARLNNRMPEKLPSAQEIALAYVDDVVKYQPPEFWKTRLQRFFTYYCQNFSFAHYFSSQVLNASDPEDAKKRVEEYFLKVPEDLKINFYK